MSGWTISEILPKRRWRSQGDALLVERRAHPASKRNSGTTIRNATWRNHVARR